VLADTLGKLGALVFTGATKADGLLNVTVVECDRVPLGEMISSYKSGRAKITVEMQTLHLDGPIPKLIAKAADLDTDGIRGSIPLSTLTFENGRVTTDLTVQVDKLVKDPRTGRDVLQGLPLKFGGSMDLDTLQLHNFAVTIPNVLLRGDVKKFFPSGIDIALKGTAVKPQFDLEEAIRKNALKGILVGATGGGTEGQQDPLGGLLEQITGGNRNNNEQGKQQQQQPQQPPQQQPRERQR
jgi:hypothetical protein